MLPPLEGQLIGSIRRIHFQDADGRPGSDPTPMIELETKSGRYVHLLAARDSESILIRNGPAQPQAGQPAPRRWEDLTQVLPAAFDGRPAITRIFPVGVPPSTADGVAAVWVFELSNGAALRWRWSRTGPQPDASTT